MIHVPANEIDQHWPRVAAGLARIIARTQPAWTAGDVLCALASGGAFLFLVGADGFVILQRFAGDDGKGMLFVLASAGKDWGGDRPAVYAEIEEVARRMQCRVIRMISPRAGWQRDPYWSLVGHVYEHEVAK